MGRGSRQSHRRGSSEIPRAGIMRVGDVVDADEIGAVRIEEIEIDGQEVGAVPWTAAGEVRVRTSEGGRWSGDFLQPRRFSPIDEINESLRNDGHATASGLEERLGWERVGIRDILADAEADGTIRTNGEDENFEMFYEAAPPRLAEDRAEAVAERREGVHGVLRLGDVVCRPGKSSALVEEITVCPPGQKDGLGTVIVEAVPWSGAGGRDFVVSLSDGTWAWAHQISPPSIPPELEIAEKLSRGEQSLPELAGALGERDTEKLLDALSERELVRSRQVFSRSDEYQLYELTEQGRQELLGAE